MKLLLAQMVLIRVSFNIFLITTRGEITMKKLFSSMIACTMALITTMSTAQAAGEGFEFTGNVALTNDYKFYGFSQSNEGFAVSGGFDLRP